MKGDFSRGYNPDRKRDRRYRRVLMQQGRLLLDSDVNALVDALDQSIRTVAGDVGCPKGSPDLGYLVTPGPLLALFKDLDHVRSAGPDIRRDHARKYRERYPALLIGGANSAGGSVEVNLRQDHPGGAEHPRIVLWMQADTHGVTVTLGSTGNAVVSLPVPVSAGFQAVEYAADQPCSSLKIEVSAGDQVRIGMIESWVAATEAPLAHAATGHFHLDGVVAANRDDLQWQLAGLAEGESVIAPGGGFELANGDLLLAYLEVWERHLTAVEDPGMRETALGGGDTCTRTQTMGQVRLMAVSETDPAALRAWFRDPYQPESSLTIDTPAAPPDPDPCALPVAGGYTGADNRLYRFEVHAGGDADAAGSIVKWSRNNGSELYAIDSFIAADMKVQLSKSGALSSGTIVELLSEAIELSDETHANPAELFEPAERKVGQLARLSSPEDDGLTWTLTELDGTALTLDSS
jgi:hypothetical protein